MSRQSLIISIENAPADGINSISLLRAVLFNSQSTESTAGRSFDETDRRPRTTPVKCVGSFILKHLIAEHMAKSLCAYYVTLPFPEDSASNVFKSFIPTLFKRNKITAHEKHAHTT